jgi:hypothetical protein
MYVYNHKVISSKHYPDDNLNSINKNEFNTFILGNHLGKEESIKCNFVQ